MKSYEKPEVIKIDSRAEGVYLASGGISTCRFGRTEANPGSDTCQFCSISGGTRSGKVGDEESPRREDYTGCIDGMPEKQ